jgi:glycine dehydrogenase subunit 1
MQPKGYNVLSGQVRDELLAAIGLKSADDLFKLIPDEIRLKQPLNLPAARSEWEVEKHIRRLAASNANARTHTCFIGAGFYDQHVPAAVDALVARGEFLTAYTPYQPEMSQGLLQVLFEYQQSISKILGLPVVNSSSYDGATALAESAWIAVQSAKTPRVAVSGGLWPEYRRVLETYCAGRNVEIVTIPLAPSGTVDPAAVTRVLAEHRVAGCVIQSPNCLGAIEDVSALVDVTKRAGVLFALSYNPWLSGLFATPGSLGVDLVAGEGQVLGLPLSAGGPSLGLLAVRKELRHLMPGRIIGKVADIYGKPAYAMVYEDREQHVARERATSNLCSNQALNAIRSSVYLSLLGENGFARLANVILRKAHYLKELLVKVPGVSLAHDRPFFNELLLKVPVKVDGLLRHLEERRIFGGLDGALVGKPGHLLVAVTENKSRQELDAYVAHFGEYVRNHER